MSGESERLGFMVHSTAATFHRPGELSNDLGFLGAEANLIFLLLSNSEAHVLVDDYYLSSIMIAYVSGISTSLCAYLQNVRCGEQRASHPHISCKYRLCAQGPWEE